MNKIYIYKIVIRLNCSSILFAKKLNNKLFASLQNNDSINTEQFKIIDYNFTTESSDKEFIDIFILDKIRSILLQIMNNNNYDESLFEPKLFEEAIKNNNFIITEYEIGQIYTLAEIYFKLLQKPTCYGSIIEFIVAYDLRTN